MASVDERSLALGRVYARAILELGEAQGESASLLDEIGGLAHLLDGDPELAQFFSSPLIEPEVREPVIEKVFRGRASDLLVDTLQIINRKGRLGMLRAIAEAYRQEYRDLHGLVDARVRTAVPLSAELRARLREAVARFTGRQPSLIETVEPALMGAALDRRASQEIQRGNASFVE
jgi:F-type H+-transporting ATPase subunit delta